MLMSAALENTTWHWASAVPRAFLTTSSLTALLASQIEMVSYGEERPADRGIQRARLSAESSSRNSHSLIDPRGTISKEY